MISVFYEKQPTPVLERVLKGLERHYDTYSTDVREARLLPGEQWLINRMHMIRTILDTRKS